MAEVVEEICEARTRRFRPYPEYKESGIGWLGQAPSHWVAQRLRSTVASCLNGVWGGEPDGVNDIACVRVADFDRTRLRVDMRNPTLRSVERKAALGRIIEPGDLLLEKSGGGDKQPVGAVVRYDHEIPAVCSNFVARMAIAEGFDSRFITYLHAALYALRINVRSIKQSTGIQNLDAGSYLSERAALPPIDEQRKIATFLDRETARIDELVAKKEQLIELLQEKRTALITRAVTQGLDPTVPMKDSGIEWLGKIPAHWHVRPLVRCTDQAAPIVYGILLPGPRLSEGVRYIGAGDVTPERLKRELLPCTTEEIAGDYRRSVVRARDLVYAIRGSFGNVEVVPDELDGVNLSRDAARIAPSKLIDSGWLCWALKAATSQAYFRHHGIGTAVTGVNIRDLKRVPIAVPPSVEQDSINAFLLERTRAIDELAALAVAGIARLRELRDALISAAVTGKIDVREEPV